MFLGSTTTLQPPSPTFTQGSCFTITFEVCNFRDCASKYLRYVENTKIPMAERLTAIQNFGFLVKIPIAESLTPVQVFCFLVIYLCPSRLGWFSATLLPCDFGVRLWFPVRDFHSSVVEGCCMYWLSSSTNRIIVFMVFCHSLKCYCMSHLSLCNFMARIPDKIKSIDGSKETLKLAVRITDLWFVGTPNKSEQAKMVFVDSENDGQFRVCEHEYKLFFIGVTVVREANLHELPFKEFRFVEFANVVAGNFVSGLLVGECSHNLCFHFDHNFFEFFSMTYFHFWWFKILLGSLIRWSFGMFHRKIPGIKDAQVSNSFKASKLLINDPMLEIQEFKERLLDLGVEVSRVLLPGDQASSQVSRGSQLSSKDSFLSKDEAKTILEINVISEDDVCVTVGTISKIVMDNHSWCYPACAQCHRKTDIQTEPFTCGCGKDNDQSVLRYRVEVMVTQNNESNKFLLWDRECAELIGETADDVNMVKIEDGDLDLNASPQALDKLLGHVLAFKVGIQSKFKNAVELRYSKDLNLINVVLEMLPDSEACSKIDPSNVDCNDATQAERRMSSDEADDELGSSQILPAQLSSNQLTRHSHKS
ncbi:hypothetical protein HKD37_06G017085 [Glycine soja]